jgi:hypothetical protein
MNLSRSTSLVTVSLLCLVAMPASAAVGATKKKSKTPARPTVRSVAPLKAGVGDQLTIKGRNFVSGKKRNTILFKAGSRPAVTAKAEQATRTTIKIVIPKTVERYITVKDGVAQPTRFRLRVLSKRFAKDYTAVRLSPTISPGNAGAVGGVTVAGPDCDADGIANSVDSDDDNDLLSDALEITLKLDTCGPDSDADGIEDGFEYQSALDLNNTVGQARPFAGKRPYPNALDGNDALTDYDGDGLSSGQEYLMWKAYGPRTLALAYSAGLKRSTAGSGNDDYRDVDSDGLSNFDEFNGPMSNMGWWRKAFATEQSYTEAYDGTSAVDPDSDGDGVLDGPDDVDHDLWTNAQEVYRIGYRTQPFNPCLPDYNSPTCSDHQPFENPYPPFDQPAGTPLPASPIAWP